MDYPKMLAAGVAVVGRYEPKILDGKAIEASIREFVNTCHFEWHNLRRYAHIAPNGLVEVREPVYNQALTKERTASNWHQDTNGVRDEAHDSLGLVLWSNREQTEILLPSGDIIKAEPGDVVLVRNSSVRHRTPHQISEDRWFARAMVVVPEWMKIVK